MEEESKIENLVKNIKSYAETRFDIGVLTLQDKTATLLSSIAVVLVVGILCVFVILFASIGSAWCIGKYLNNPYSGYFIISGFYLLVAVIVFINRDKWITLPIINSLLKKININEK